MDNIGQRLREERQLRGWSQRDLARETGVNTDTISGIETGQHEPRPSTLRKLAGGLGIEVRDLFMEPALPKGEAPRGAGRPELETRLSELSYREFMDWVDEQPLEFVETLPNRLSEKFSLARRGYIIHAANFRKAARELERAETNQR